MENKYWYVGVDNNGEVHMINADNKKYLNKKIEWLRYKTKNTAIESVKDYIINYRYRPYHANQGLKNLCSAWR